MYIRACAVALALGIAPTAPANGQATLEAAPNQDAEKLAIAHEIVDRGFPAGSREAMFFGTMDQMVHQMRSGMQRNLPEMDSGAEQVLDEWLAEWIGTAKGILRQHSSQS
ncbi:MAG: hypothetical protein ACR2FJ_02140 [Qipengyuania sp.]